MSNPLSCRDVQALLFELHRDELSDLKSAGVGEHLRTCDECCQLATKIGDMVDAAGDADPADWADIDADGLFGRIETTIDDGECSPSITDDDGRLDELFDAARDADARDWADIDSEALFDRIETAIDDSERSPSTTDDESALDELFDTARDAGAHDWADIDSEALFDRISAEIDSPDTSDTSPNDGTDDTDPSTQPTVDAPANDDRPRRLRLWVAAAAAACAAIAGWWLISTVDTPSPTTTDVVSSQTDESDDQHYRGADEHDDVSPVVSLPVLQPDSSPRQSVRLFTGQDTTYRFLDTDDHDEVALTEGAILVEYRPDAETPFSIQAQSHTITVTGTVFSVEIQHEAPRIAVFEGSVRVTRPDGSTHDVERGEFIAGEQRGRLDEASHSEVSRHIDLDAHRRLIRDVQQAASRHSQRQIGEAMEAAQARIDELEVQLRPPAEQPEPDEPQAQPPQPEVSSPDEDTPPKDDDAEVADSAVDESVDDEELDEPQPRSSRQLREAALQALHDDAPRQAADLLERALERTESNDPARADILLELARIHLRELDEPQRAADHLHHFLDRWPDDPAADAIHSQLCDMDIDITDDLLCE